MEGEVHRAAHGPGGLELPSQPLYQEDIGHGQECMGGSGCQKMSPYSLGRGDRDPLDRFDAFDAFDVLGRFLIGTVDRFEAAA